MNGCEGQSLYDAMLDHPDRLASKSYVELAYQEVENEIERIESRLGESLTAERRRLDQEKPSWKFMTRSNIYQQTQLLIGMFRNTYSGR